MQLLRMCRLLRVRTLNPRAAVPSAHTAVVSIVVLSVSATCHMATSVTRRCRCHLQQLSTFEERHSVRSAGARFDVSCFEPSSLFHLVYFQMFWSSWSKVHLLNIIYWQRDAPFKRWRDAVRKLQICLISLSAMFPPWSSMEPVVIQQATLTEGVQLLDRRDPVLVSDLIPASSTCSCTRKNTTILQTETTLIPSDIIFSSTFQEAEARKYKASVVHDVLG